MRRCRIPTGCKRPDTPCCADCRDKSCPARCWNHPKRCGCWEDVPPPKRGMARKLDWDRVAQLHEDGLPNKEIAARVGCAPQTVSAILRKRGGREDG